MILKLGKKINIFYHFNKQVNYVSFFHTQKNNKFNSNYRSCQYSFFKNINKFYFSQSKNKQQDISCKKNEAHLNSEHQNIQFSSQEQKQIQNYQPDENFNLIMNVQLDRNLKKDLIIARKKYENSTKELRAAILFQDLLRTQIKIVLYDTHSKPYFHQIYRLLFYVFFFASSFWFIKTIQQNDPKNKIILQRTPTGKSFKFLVYTYAIWTLLRGLLRYFRFQRRFVEKIIYDTESQNFLFTKRKFFGKKYQEQISRFKLVYTQNKFLNKKGTNYFHIQTKDQYSIPYKQFWKKQDLFSHLISQRIKL